MHLFLGFALAATLLLAQEITTYSSSSGRVVTESRTKSSLQRTELTQSINGRQVPLEQIEERLLKEDAAGRTVERIVHRFDPNGKPSPPEKTVIEEQKRPDGATIRSSTYRSDLNGNLQLSERSVTETRKSASGLSSEIAVERPTPNGGLETVEKTTVVQAGTPENYQESATTLRKGASGFYPALKVVTNHTGKAGQTTENSAQYEVGSSGSLELHSQTVLRVEKRPDGSESREQDVFDKSVPGTIDAPGAKLRLKEREYVERRPGSGGSVTETVSVRRPSVSDPNVLGPPRIVSETVCRGNCKP